MLLVDTRPANWYLVGMRLPVYSQVFRIRSITCLQCLP